MTVMGSSGYTGPPDSTTLMMPDFRSSLPSGVPLGTMSCTHNRRGVSAQLLCATVVISSKQVCSATSA